MCRHIGYLGAPCSPAEAMFDAPHSLLHQSYAPNDMRCPATANADGFGLGWYDGKEVLRYRRASPLWTDTTLAPLSRTLRVTAFVAAARSATLGMPITEAASAPFTEGRWLFSHNGVIIGWPDAVAGLAAELPVTDLLRLDAPTDSALLWALVRDRLRRGEDLVAAARETVLAVETVAPGSRLNLLLGDSERLVATAWRHALSVSETDRAVILASEPYDEPDRWREVPQGSLVHVTVGPDGIPATPVFEEI